jgi:hypothetical protein
MTELATKKLRKDRTKKTKSKELFKVSLRQKHQPAAAGKTFAASDPLAAFADARADMSLPAMSEPMITWVGKEKLCILDVDFHGKYKPDRFDLEKTILRLRPEPARYWISHGGGVKCVYTASDRLTAEEVAAIAAMLLRRELPGATGFELASQTRHPGYIRLHIDHGEQRCGEVLRGAHPGLAEAKRVLLGGYHADYEPDTELIAEWCLENAYEPGARYPHSRCPIDPCESAGNDPVEVRGHGIQCYRCDAVGRRSGAPALRPR